MSDATNPMARAGQQQFLRRIHEPAKKYLREWLDMPAHIHHVAHRMANPPLERPQSQKEFRQLLRCLEVPEETSQVSDKFGFGTRTEPNGDRLVVVWEAHTEYYSYQVWHIPHDKTKPLEFGPLNVPGYAFPLSPLGIRVNALDIIIAQEPHIAHDKLRARLPGPHIYASRVFGDDIVVATSFTPDEHLRERYLIFSASSEALGEHLSKLVDTVVTIENYYHLILLPLQAFSRAVDQLHDYEQRHLYQRGVIVEQLDASMPQALQKWLTVLSQDLLQVSRLAQSMRYRLSASVPYDSIVRGNLHALQERPFPPLRPLSDYVYSRITGVAEGYQQFLRRIAAMQSDFEATITVIRTRIEMLLQEQNLALQGQNSKLLASVDSTTRGQAILQRTVESLSVIVITYYLTGLVNYLFNAFQEMGWLAKATYATAIFVPIAFGISFGLMTLGRKVVHKWSSAPPKKDSNG